MAYTPLTVQACVISGLEASFVAAAAAGNSFANDGYTFLEVVNGDSSDHVVTITTPKTYGGIALADPTVTVTAGERRHIGPFPKELFNQSDGAVLVNYDGVTSVTVAAIRCKPSAV